MIRFLKQNWYKLMIGSSLLLFAAGFFIYSVSSAYAGNSEQQKYPNYNHSSTYVQLPVNKDGSINVKFTEEQLKQLASFKNWEGTLIGCGQGIYKATRNNDFGDGYGWEKIGP